jgi:signal transduction histidine kinase
MQTSISEVATFTILISTSLILLFGSVVIIFLFRHQKKRYLYQKELLELREEFNQTLMQSKLEIQEQTLDHIAKELHANFSHLVSLININLSEILPHSSDDMRESIIETKSLAKQLLGELKALSASLNTDHIVKIGFTKAFENELGRLSKIRKYKVSFTSSDNGYQILPEHEIILFRLCQEVLNNIVQYAKATSITASMVYSLGNLVITINDNGIGFNIVDAEQMRAVKESTGLLNIKKRAGLINGDVKIDSIVGIGTTVTIVVPVCV